MDTLQNQFCRQLDNLSKADIHIHSNFSDGAASIEEILDYVQEETDLAVIAITDHDTIKGALLAKKIMENKKYRFEVIVGQEVSSSEGHILALFIDKPIKPLQGVKETIDQIHQQGGLAIAAHPLYASHLNHLRFSPVNGVGSKELLKYRTDFDGIETVNATPLLGEENLRAKYLNRLLLFRSETGSSDAHILGAIGKGYTIFEGKNANDFKNAIFDCQTQSMNERWGFFGILRYGFFFLPSGFRTAFHTMVFGPSQNGRDLVKYPNRFKIKKELVGTEID